MIGKRSKIEVYLHMVWCTKCRDPKLSDDIEMIVYRCATQEAQRLKCCLLAIGGTSDHVHVIVCLSSTATIAGLAKQMKGVSSALVNEKATTADSTFAWQDGYACFSISRPHLPKAIAYVKNQKSHHSRGLVWAEWEEVNKPAALSPASEPKM